MLARLVRLVVVFGSMFSGKSEELLRRIRLERIAGRRVLVIKPYNDTRTNAYIAARALDPDGQVYERERVEATVIHDDAELEAALTADVDAIFADECQFFRPPHFAFARAIRNVLRRRAHENLLIVCAGLDTDYALNGFGPMPALIAMADERFALTGVCMKCRARGACLTQRTAGSTAQVQVGDAESYEIRCPHCHYVYEEETEPAP